MINISSYAEILYQNNHVDIINDACKLCYNSKPEPTLEKKLKYIESKVKFGHESVIEHSNIIILLVNTTGDLKEFIEILEAGEYIKSCTKESKKIKGLYYHILNGNIRAFKNIFRNIKNTENGLAKLLLDSMYNIPKEYFYDFIGDNIMEERKFANNELIYSRLKSTEIEPVHISDNVMIQNIDHLHIILNELNSSVEDIFEYNDIIDMCSITIKFSNISRVISQQYTRHRNAISQRSQRYVDEEGCKTNNPLKYSSYLPENKIFNTSITSGTLDEIANKINSIYKELRDQGLKKQDARYLLSQNVYTDFYMTFSFKKFIHFCDLRSDQSSQPEIRYNTKDLLEYFENEMRPILGNDIFWWIAPEYIKQLTSKHQTEEIIEEEK